MAPDAKISQLVELMTDLKKKVVNLEEKRMPRTPIEVLEQRRDVANQVAKGIEDAKQTFAKDVEQVSRLGKP